MWEASTLVKVNNKTDDSDIHFYSNRLNATNQTELFKSCTRTIRARNKALGTVEPPKPLSNILPKNDKNKSNLYLTYKELYAQIYKLHEYLIENKNIYLKQNNNLLGNDKVRIEKEKETIEYETQEIIKMIKSRVLKMNRSLYAKKDVYSEQLYEHYEQIGQFIEAYLKKAADCYLSMKKKNEQFNENYNAMFKLGKKVGNTGAISNFVDVESKTFDENLENEYGELSPEEIQTFKTENDSLFKDLTTLNQEVEQIESKILKVAELQQVLTENIYDQAQNVEKILNTFVGTTENLQDGNEQLRQAIQGGATLRLFVILILLVLSFTVLFLNYYND